MNISQISQAANFRAEETRCGPQGELNWEGATVDKTIETLVEDLLKE